MNKQAKCWLDLPDNESMKECANERTNERTNKQTKKRYHFFLWKKQRNMWRKSKENLQKRQLQAFSAEKKSPQKLDSAIFWALLIRVFVQKIRRNKWWNLEKMPKTRFSGIFPAFSAEKIFFENWSPSYFRYCHFTSVCKIWWKNIKYSSRNSRNTVFPVKSAVPAIFRKLPTCQKWIKSL